MRIAFVNPNTHSGNPRPNLGLLSVATVCQDAGYPVKIIDANLLNLSPEGVAEEAEDYEVIGITAMTPTIHEAVKIAQALMDKTIILGGVHASIFPDDCADTGMFDAVVVGEGENIILDIIKKAKQDKPRQHCDIYAGTPVDLNKIPLPDYSLLNLSAYKPPKPHAERTPWTIATSSRGCVYNCSFCSKAVSGNHFHAMTADRMIELISMLQSDFDIQDITFYDDLFTFNGGIFKNRIKDFATEINYRNIDLTWSCESRVNLANEEMLSWMKMAGCRLIYYGIESGNQSILDRLNKGITIQQIQKAIKLTHEAGIKAAGYFMLGCPGETKETIKQTVDFACGLGLDHAQFSVCSPMPGSKLYNQYVEAGYPVPDWSAFKYLGNGDKPMFYSDQLSKTDIEEAVQEANRIFTKEKVNI